MTQQTVKQAALNVMHIPRQETGCQVYNGSFKTVLDETLNREGYKVTYFSNRGNNDYLTIKGNGKMKNITLNARKGTNALQILNKLKN